MSDFTSVLLNKNEESRSAIEPSQDMQDHEELSNSGLISSKLINNDKDNDDNKSINDNENNEEITHIDKQKYKLTVTVENPTLENDSNPFINYELHIITDNPRFKQTDFIIKHRYSDFDILRKCLKFDYPTLLIPPLPTKQRLEYIKGGRFTNEFITKRCNSLNLFIQRILKHSVLCDCEIFMLFLDNSNYWDNYKKNLNLSDNNNMSASTNLSGTEYQYESVTDYLMNSFKKVNTESKYTKNFKEIEFNRSKLQENLNKIDRIYNKVISKQELLSKEFSVFGDEFNKLSILMNNDYNGKYRNNEEIDPNTIQIINKFKSFSENLNENSQQYTNLNKFIEFKYLNNLKDLEHYLISINNLIKLKDYKILDYEMLNNYLEKSVIERDNLQNGGSIISSSTEGTISYISKKLEMLRGTDTSTNDSNDKTLINERIEKLNERIKVLNDEILKSKMVYEKYEIDVINEWKQFQAIKDSEIGESLDELSKEYCQMYEDSIHVWEGFESENGRIKFEDQLKDQGKSDQYFADDGITENANEINDLIKGLDE